MKASSKFIELYNLLFAFICFGAMAASLSYTFRLVRGHYHWFTLSDENAIFFFLGAILILLALLTGIIYALGPVGASPSELFWRYPGIAKLSRSPWKVFAIWGALALWGLLAVLLATILAPFSVTWLVGAASLTLILGLVLVQWGVAVQVTEHRGRFTAWGILAGLLGVGINFITTLKPALVQNHPQPVVWLVGAVLALALMGALTDSLRASKEPMTWEKSTRGNARRAVLLHALSSISHPEGYRFYGSTRTRLQEIRSTKPAVISALAALDSTPVMLVILALSLPLGIFFSTVYGSIGAGLTTVIGCWLLALLFRWHAREWTAHPSLRTWLGAPALPTLLGFCTGPVLMSFTYTLSMMLIFALPWHMPLTALLMALFIAMGETNPATHINYDLTITTIEGLHIPIEPFIMILKHLGLIIVLALLMNTTPLFSLGFLTLATAHRINQHRSA